jgi:P4 family phage/plasmid primase-like protien
MPINGRPPDPLVDDQQIRAALRVLVAPGDVVELRSLAGGKRGTISGYFNDLDRLAESAVLVSRRTGEFQPSGIYITLNPINPNLLARAVNRLERYAKHATADGDVLSRRWFFIDLDPVRPAGISATEPEHEAAHTRASEIEEYLHSLGFPEPILADSGNGAHLLYRIGVPNDATTTALLRGCLAALDSIFSDPTVAVDRTTHNPARLVRLYGTVARKGDSTPERRHRVSRILKAPSELVEASSALLRGLAGKLPGPRKPMTSVVDRGVRGRSIKWSDVQPFVADRISKEKSVGNGVTIIEIRGCPFDPNDHMDDRAGSFTLFADGGVTPSCRHDHCQGKGLNEFLAAYASHLLPAPGKQERSGNEAIKTRFADPAGGDHVEGDDDDDGERLRIQLEELGEIQRAIKKNGRWTASMVEWLVAEKAFINHFARDVGEKLYLYEGGVYKPKGEERICKLTKAVVPGENWSSHLASETIERVRVDSCYLLEQPALKVLNLQNGLLDLDKLELKPHSPGYLSAVQLPVRYDPKAECPAWEKQINETFPPDTVQAGTAWEIVAWLMVPCTSLQKALLLLGPGGTGKSTFLFALRHFLGGYRNVSAVSLQKLESDRFAASRLVGKLANICADLPSTHLETSSIFKQITGGDPVVAEYKFKDSFDFVPFARLIFSANQPPQSKDATDAFFQRWQVLHFTNVFRGTLKELSSESLMLRLTAPAELSGVLNKALEALPRVLGGGLTCTDSMREAHEEFWKATDPLSIWLVQNTIDDPDAYIPKSSLIDAYNSAAGQNGRAGMNTTAFGLALKRLRPHLKDVQRKISGKDKVWCYLGIGLGERGRLNRDGNCG